jgi:hypothetical protein
MVRLLRRQELTLFVTRRAEYIEFLLEAPELLAAEGESAPPTYLWMQNHCGTMLKRMVLFGNQPPPWPEPALDPPCERLDEADSPDAGTNAATPTSRRAKPDSPARQASSLPSE